MKLGKPINKLDDLKQEDFLNKKAFIHFNTKNIKDEKELGATLGIKPPKGLYMSSQIVIFHMGRFFEHGNVRNTNPNDPNAFYISSADADADGNNVDLVFKQTLSTPSNALSLTKLEVWIHNDLKDHKLRYKADPQLPVTNSDDKWDTIFCEADIPDF